MLSVRQNFKRAPRRGNRMAAARVRRLWAAVRGLPWQRFAAGVIAGGAGLALTFLLRVFGLGVFLPEVATDFVVGRIPGSVESFFIRTMGEGAKLLGLLTALLAFLAVHGVYATLYRRVERRLPWRWAMIAVYTVVPAAIALLFVLPLLGGGFLGAATTAGAGMAAFSQLLGSLLYAAVLDYFFVEVARRHPEGFHPSRRQFIVASALTLAGAVLAIYGLGSIVSRPGRLSFGSVAEMEAREITPTQDFYTVTKNVIDPAVDGASWRLAVDGLVSTPATYAYDDLAGLPQEERVATLECVSNEVGGDLISTAIWGGVGLKDLLERAGPAPSAGWVEFTCADGYTVAVPIGRATSPDSLLALRMNGLPLQGKHGYPARVIVPGVYGMFNAKWVTRITLVEAELLGFWQQKGWTNRGLVRTTAIVATPPDGSVVGSPVRIGGVAFAGDRGISQVEVSTDGGATWSPATLLPALSGLTWRLWTFDWTPASGGSHRIVARAVDGTGTPQESAQNAPFPDGSSGYDSISLLASG